MTVFVVVLSWLLIQFMGGASIIQRDDIFIYWHRFVLDRFNSIFNEFIILLIFKLTFTHAFSEVINNIEVKNNNRITKETIITFGGIELGKDYSKQQLNEIFLDLFNTN